MAIPAQRSAGVTKQFGAAPRESGLTLKTFMEMPYGELALSAEEVQSLQTELTGLEKLAAAGRRLREMQVQQVIRTAAVLQPGLTGEVIRRSLAVLTEEELEAVAESCRKALRRDAVPQLAAAAAAQINDYRI